MARRTIQLPEPKPCQLTPAQMQNGIQRIQRRIRELEALDLSLLSEDNIGAITDRLNGSVDDTLVRTYGNDTVEYDRYRRARLSYPMVIGGRVSTRDKVEAIEKSRLRAMEILGGAISSLGEQLSETSEAPLAENEAAPQFDYANRRVFIVHGRTEGPREAVARFLARIGFEPIILHEQPNSGQTIMEKFEKNSDVGLAVVLLTAEDFGGLDGEEAKARARQNVIFELGYFAGKLGRERVCPILCGDLDLPSDIDGVGYTKYDAGGAWHVGLSKELEAAGYEINWNRVMGN